MADTIFALSSGRPPAAISIIRLSGPRAHGAGAGIAGLLPEARTAAVRELRDPLSGELLDEALVLRFDSPASSTGEDAVEFHCHGGRAVVDAVLTALGSLEGLRAAEPGEFTRRAFENGRIDLTEAEGLADLIEAETESQRKVALALAEGGLRKQIEGWQARLLSLSAEAERAIDYDDDDLTTSPALAAECGELTVELLDWLKRPRIEPLKDGVRVVIAGPPNVGKSSLINAIAGAERAIVTDIPGTTRDHIELPLSLGGVPILLTDTAGLRDTQDQIEAIGVARAAALVEAADVLVWLGEPAVAPGHSRLIQVHPKADLPGRGSPPAGSTPVSSVTGEGVSAVLERVGQLAATLLPGEGAIALNRRQAERIGEAAEALESAARAPDCVILAEGLRHARSAFDHLTGKAGVEDLLDSLFGRFCLGK
jgi:tRNA modification GTPase